MNPKLQVYAKLQDQTYFGAGIYLYKKKPGCDSGGNSIFNAAKDVGKQHDACCVWGRLFIGKFLRTADSAPSTV